MHPWVRTDLPIVLWGTNTPESLREISNASIFPTLCFRANFAQTDTNRQQNPKIVEIDWRPQEPKISASGAVPLKYSRE